MPLPSELFIQTKSIPDGGDVTVYNPIFQEGDNSSVPHPHLEKFLEKQGLLKEPSKSTADGGTRQVDRAKLDEWDVWEGKLELGSTPNASSSRKGRGLVAKCFDGKYLSITLRIEPPTQNKAAPVTPAPAPVTPAPAPVTPAPAPVTPARSPWDIVPATFKNAYVGDGEALLKDLGQRINGSAGQKLDGLVVVSGATQCYKSVITRALIIDRLRKLCAAGGKRRPHLVTLEDPIETPLDDNPDKVRALYGIDYTPRALGRVPASPSGSSPKGDWRYPVGDCRNLDEGLRNCLRMTPAVVYIGEVRDDDAWPAIIKFAATGHLVYATMHASSLGETFKKILESTSEPTPAGRATVARAILAAIHLKPIDIGLEQSGSTKKGALLPQLWCRTTGSVAALVADGLSSVQPTRLDPDRQGMTNTACLSRACFLSHAVGKGTPQFRNAITKVLEAEFIDL